MIQSGADAIRPAWFGLAAHARACEQCRPGVLALQAVPDDPRRADFEAYEGLCSRGQELFTAWRGAKDEWLEQTRSSHRRKQFIMDDQLQEDGVSFDLRSKAIMSMPPPAFQKWLELPDDRRHAELRALENAMARGHIGEVRGVARDITTDRILYRWSCDCGAAARRDYFEAKGAREAWERHAGRTSSPPSSASQLVACEGCGNLMPRQSGRFCSAACRISQAHQSLTDTENPSD